MSTVKVKSDFPVSVRDILIDVSGDKLNVVCMAVDRVVVIVSGMLRMKLATVFMVRPVEIGFDVSITKSFLVPKI